MKYEGANPAARYGLDKQQTAQLLNKPFKNQRRSANRIKCDIFIHKPKMWGRQVIKA